MSKLLIIRQIYVDLIGTTKSLKILANICKYYSYGSLDVSVDSLE